MSNECLEIYGPVIDHYAQLVSDLEQLEFE